LIRNNRKLKRLDRRFFGRSGFLREYGNPVAASRAGEVCPIGNEGFTAGEPDPPGTPEHLVVHAVRDMDELLVLGSDDAGIAGDEPGVVSGDYGVAFDGAGEFRAVEDSAGNNGIGVNRPAGIGRIAEGREVDGRVGTVRGGADDGGAARRLSRFFEQAGAEAEGGAEEDECQVDRLPPSPPADGHRINHIPHQTPDHNWAAESPRLPARSAAVVFKPHIVRGLKFRNGFPTDRRTKISPVFPLRCRMSPCEMTIDE
jgi:hypothetical protein